MTDTQAFVYTVNRVGQVGAWSRYLFPWNIRYTTQLGNTVYVRAGRDVYCLTEDTTTDDVFLNGVIETRAFDSVIWWPWLDMNRPGALKMMMGFDMVGVGCSFVEIGFDQSDKTAFTEPLQVKADTMTGQVIPMMLNAPSFSVRITYPGGQNWEFLGANIYLNDARFMA